MDFKESTITNYSGLSTETKPTIAAGTAVPNGSRWREVDTGKTYHFDLATDVWYQSSPQIDSSTHAIETIEYEHHEIHSGSHYFVAGYQDLGLNDVLDFTWQMPNTTKWIHWTWQISTESETLWQIYEGVTATNPLANVITPYNNNRNSTKTSGTAMRFEVQSSLAVANADTAVGAAALLESGVSGAGKNSGNSTRSNELVLDQGVLYCLRATAQAAGNVSFIMEWYEHTDKV
jgi:hypothetical protein